MAEVWFPFDDYPVLVSGKPRLVAGAALVKLVGRFPSPVVVLSERSRGASNIMVERPLQSPTRWVIERIVLADVDPMGTDVAQWFTGKFWYAVPRRLYVQWLLDRGFTERAEVYARLAA